jgi:IMP cyclohydrolase
MHSTFASLARLAYPGRVLLIGRSRNGAAVVAYAITGRSPSSQARRLVARNAGIWVEPTDEAVLRKGNPELLVYPAFLFGRAGIAASNGRQTADVLAALVPGADPVAALAVAVRRWDYEPDEPNYTPRISGCVTAEGAALSVIRRGPGGRAYRNCFEVPLVPGQARLVSTYRGDNADPLPAFEGEPLDLVLEAGDAETAARSFYAALAPSTGAPDFRVSAACVFIGDPGAESHELHIHNRHERT